jgi:hypothetical protein
MSKHVQPAGLVAAEQAGDSERRGEIRHDATKLGTIKARLIGGSEVSLVNFSNRGVLFESDSRLLVGARASVRLTTTDANLVVTGRVVRSRVKGVVNGALRYDAALALDSELALALPEEPVAAEPEPAPVSEPAPDPPAAVAESVDGAPDAGVSPEDAQPEVAIAFDPAPATLAADDPEWESHSDQPLVVATQAVAEDEAAVLQLYASVPHDLAELRRIAADNQW